MTAKENSNSAKRQKFNKKGQGKDENEHKKPLLSARQIKILLILIAAMFILVPIVDNFRCKAACLKRVKTPYPEIACGYECPWPWNRSR